MRVANLIYVDANGSTQSNKYYNMVEDGATIKVEYGRVGSTKSVVDYPISKWNSIYNEKIKKGYTDITDLKSAVVVQNSSSGNLEFDEFYSHFSKYVRTTVKKNYLVEGCTKKQIEEAQKVINTLSSVNSVVDANSLLLQLYKIIPRKMNNVRDFLIGALSELNYRINLEQDALDSMDSNNIVVTTDPLKELNIKFSVENNEESEFLKKWIPSTTKRPIKIHKLYKIENNKQPIFNNWLDKQKDKTTQLLIHGTRNPNIFSILKSDLLIRPSNAATISGNAYGDGIYHSAHTDKSLNYVGGDPDKIFFIQRVHMGNPYTYNGWYRDGKDISRSQMNYNYLSGKGYDSLYVKPGDGLLNSEYIVYNAEQTVTNYLVWLK